MYVAVEQSIPEMQVESLSCHSNRAESIREINTPYITEDTATGAFPLALNTVDNSTVTKRFSTVTMRFVTVTKRFVTVTMRFMTVTKRFATVTTSAETSGSVLAALHRPLKASEKVRPC